MRAQQKLRAKELQRRRRVAKMNYLKSSGFFWKIGLAVVGFVAIAIISSVITSVAYELKIIDLNVQITELQQENNSNSNELAYITLQRDNTLNLLSQVSSIAVDLDKSNTELSTEVEQLQTAVDHYEKREELFDKYEWALMDGTKKTDLTYEEIESLEQLVEEKGMTQDTTDLVISLAMQESRCSSNAENPKSTARGYGQILSGTGKMIYERLMGNPKGSYNHDIAFDSETNLTMMVYYLDYLATKYDCDINLVLNEYGDGSPSYQAKLNRYLSKVGESCQTIQFYQ